jgi:hypothetical protein
MNKADACRICHIRGRLIDPKSGIIVCNGCDTARGADLTLGFPTAFMMRLLPVKALK